jgi:type IV secretory pathway ATPase VirB11/archaellum biosynthesis ATPase
MSAWEDFQPATGVALEPGAIITAPAQFVDAEFVKLSNTDATILNESTYPALVNRLAYSSLWGNLEQEINNPSPVDYDSFGYSVAIDSTGDRVIIGAQNENTGAADAGSVYIYSRSGTVWTLEREINNPSPVSADYFGISVAIDATGDRVVIGAYRENTGATDAGSAYIYSRSGTVWTLEREINNPSPVASDFFGFSVSINGTGDRVIIGAYQEDTGAVNAGSAYIYSRSGTTWTLEQEINNPSPVATDWFGTSVCINSTGDRVIIGADATNTGALNAGSAYIYSRSGTVWTLEQAIHNPSPMADDYFGWAVSINSTGDRVIIGAYNEDTGATDAGSVYIYSRSGTVWTLEQEINNPSPMADDYFGDSVSINSTGDRVIIGADGEDTGASAAGSAYIYSRSGTTWTLEQEINNPSPREGASFSFSVAIDSTGDKVIIGAYGGTAGSVYIYEMEDASVTGNIYVPPQRLTNDNTNNFLKVV